MQRLTKGKCAAAIVAVLIISALAVFFTFNAAEGVASADVLDYGVEDQVFINTLKELADYGENSLLTAEKECIYDINLETLGYVYDFNVDGTDGYAIMTNSEGIPEISEIYFEAENPYADVSGTPVYFTYMAYAYYSDGSFYWMNDREITAPEFERMEDYLYYSGGTISLVGENVAYKNRSENNKELVVRHPYCYEIIGLDNSCVSIAGTNIIQYYDRLHENLIPNYTAYNTVAETLYVYLGPGDETDAVMRQLYSDMNTNEVKPGASVNDFKSGMATFCARKNLDISYTSCMSGGTFNYAYAKQKIDEGLPVVLFVNQFYVADIAEIGTSDTINYLHGDLRHSMAGFGYKEVTYTLTNGSIRKDNYVQVASGLSLILRGYFNISKGTTVEEVLAVNIY